MPTYEQSERPIAVETPLGKDALLLTGLSGAEEFSRLFRYDLEFLSDKSDHDPTKIVGKNITFSVEHPDKEKRFFNGIVRRFAYAGTGDRLSVYRAEVVPWLWLLTRTSDCRIFQEKTVPDIIKDVFKDTGFTDFDDSGITGPHPKWEYCVQYRESDFNFVSRLMEEEGIFYYFKHEQGKHTLVLGDGPSAYKDCKDKSVMFSSNLNEPRLSDQITRWEHQYEFRSGKWAQSDYNFKDASTDLTVNTNGKLPISDAKKWEVYDYPGGYEKKSEGTDDLKFRIEQEEAGYDVVHGASLCRSFSPGGKFKISKHHNPAEAGKGYVVTRVSHQARVAGSYVTGGEQQGRIYENSFHCIPDSTPFRPERITPKPAIHGVQTALVVGPSGEEIYTDEYGRIKVQFYWDRQGKKDEKSSCWIRCAQFAAGKGWGAMSIPRVGQEVVVTYLEGDPDRPLVTGVVYNGNQKPAYKLPDEKTKTYFKSNSSKGGRGFNEIRFEDKAGSEEVLFHAQKDMATRVLNDQRQVVKNKQYLIVGGGKEAGAGDKLEKIEKDSHLQVVGKVQEKVSKDVLTVIEGNKHQIIDKNRHDKVSGNLHLKVEKNRVEKVVKKYSLETQSYHAKADQDIAIEGLNIHIKAGMALVLEAGMQVSLKVGGNFVDVSVAGVAINGMPVLINSGGAAGSGGGCSPDKFEDPEKAAPEDPEEADKAGTAKTGQKSS